MPEAQGPEAVIFVFSKLTVVAPYEGGILLRRQEFFIAARFLYDEEKRVTPNARLLVFAVSTLGYKSCCSIAL
jgi:hypothetical protein